MQVIGGKYQRQSLQFPKPIVSPNKSIVREALFNIIGYQIEAASFLDGCSGSGAIGLEAESRGASSVVCVDKDTKYLKINKGVLKANINIVRSDLIRYLKSTSHSFDIIFLDPVWSQHNVYIQAFQQISGNASLLKSGGLFIIEHDHSL